MSAITPLTTNEDWLLGQVRRSCCYTSSILYRHSTPLPGDSTDLHAKMRALSPAMREMRWPQGAVYQRGKKCWNG